MYILTYPVFTEIVTDTLYNGVCANHKPIYYVPAIMYY